jgi:hypothetical protein
MGACEDGAVLDHSPRFRPALGATGDLDFGLIEKTLPIPFSRVKHRDIIPCP